MYIARAAFTGRLLVLAASLVLVPAAPLAAQGGLLAKVSRAAQAGRAALMDMALASAPTVELEEAGLATLQAGDITIGVSSVQAKDSVGVRLRVYLYNPGAEAASVEVPEKEVFALVDDRGRRLEPLTGLRIRNLPRDARTIEVPAMERVTGTILFPAPPARAGSVMLKVGAEGRIAGIPLDGAPVQPVAAEAHAEVEPRQAPVVTSGTPSSALIGLWHGSNVAAQIEIRPDGTYRTADGAEGTYTVAADQITFAGPLAAWNGGHATLKGGNLEFYWQTPDGAHQYFAFVRQK